MADRELYKLTLYLLHIAQVADFRTFSHKVNLVLRVSVLPMYSLVLELETSRQDVSEIWNLMAFRERRIRPAPRGHPMVTITRTMYMLGAHYVF
jgi:hypothetical protein